MRYSDVHSDSCININGNSRVGPLSLFFNFTFFLWVIPKKGFFKQKRGFVNFAHLGRNLELNLQISATSIRKNLAGGKVSNHSRKGTSIKRIMPSTNHQPLRWSWLFDIQSAIICGLRCPAQKCAKELFVTVRPYVTCSGIYQPRKIVPFEQHVYRIVESSE